MNGPCRDCPSHKEPPLDPPRSADEEIAFTEEEIERIKADERDDDRRGK